MDLIKAVAMGKLVFLSFSLKSWSLIVSSRIDWARRVSMVLRNFSACRGLQESPFFVGGGQPVIGDTFAAFLVFKAVFKAVFFVTRHIPIRHLSIIPI
jgi:hypothetical protein